jgi:hypothetical protein
VSNREWSETQLAINNRIASLPPEEQARELMIQALSRLTFYGPMDEPAAVMLRDYINKGKVSKR